jgi:hypothetical protein
MLTRGMLCAAMRRCLQATRRSFMPMLVLLLLLVLVLVLLLVLLLEH